MIKIGCCGFPVNRLTYYKNFNVIEIQKTFYQLPKKETAIKWRQEAPKEFEFIVKAWQLITHPPSSPTYKKLNIPLSNKDNYGFFNPSKEVFSAWEKTEEICSALKSKIVLFQSPASFKPSPQNKENIRKFFTSINRKNYIFVWEPRGKWKDEEIKELCEQLDLIHGVDPFKNKPLYGKLRYFRLHGKDGYRYKYSEEDFKYLLSLLVKDIEIYIMFNNVYMFEDAKKFETFLKSVNF
jgi:uncharacterized protein YecE (DUF72 family)